MLKVKDQVSWLHISDFHFKSNESYDRDVVLKSLVNSLPKVFERGGKPDFIIASGDIAYSGKTEEYNKASVFFDNLLSICSLKRDKLVVIPGNHDVDRSLGKGLVRTLAGRSESDEYFSSEQDLIHVRLRLIAFLNWYNDYFSGIRSLSVSSTCSDLIEFNFDAVNFKILPINTATFCHDDHDSGKLWVGRSCIDKAVNEINLSDDCLFMAVMHHPLSWLNQVELPNVKSALRRSVDCILTGHLHTNDVEQTIGIAGGTIHLSAGAAYQTRDWPNTALLCTYRDSAISVMPVRYEDSPNSIWTVDTSLFPENENFRASFTIDRLKKTFVDADKLDIDSNLNGTILENQSAESQTEDQSLINKHVYERDFEDDLLSTSNGDLLYAKPRLMDREQRLSFENEDQALEVDFDEIISSGLNFVIQTRPEHGGTTLCKKIYQDISESGQTVFLRNARILPNYRKKLEREFPASVQHSHKAVTLIIDHFDAERDDRLLKELIATKWFSRFVVLVVDRSALQTNVAKLDISNFEFRHLYLWTVARSEIRYLAHKILRSDDDEYVSRAVDKVYRDLLGLCIPLTPSNAIMYLRILDREGEYHPLNRVDIVGRYIQELLRANSNISADAFNAKSKSDFLSELCYKMFIESLCSFDDHYWYVFCKAYQDRTLIDFDGSTLFHELMETRILVRSGRYVFFKYNYFFAYFLGRSIAFRNDRLSMFMEAEDYITVAGALDVITGLSTDNTSVMRDLTNKLKSKLNSFSSEYIDNQFDPLSKAVWPDSDQEEEKLWKPIAQEVDAGPKSTTEIDIIKTSVFSESLTADQTIKYNRFRALEHSLFATATALADTLRNADDVDGNIKLEAFDAILQSHYIALQIGTLFSEELARRRIFQWGGVLFLDFNRFVPEDEPVSFAARFNVMDSVLHSVCSKAADELGSYKLTGVYRLRTSRMKEIRSYELMNFVITLASKGPRWADSLTEFVNKTDKNSYYLCFMLDRIMHNLSFEILNTKDREDLKKIVALIHTKRSLGKKNPSAKAVNHMLRHIDKEGGFDNDPKKDREVKTKADSVTP